MCTICIFFIGGIGAELIGGSDMYVLEVFIVGWMADVIKFK